MTQSEGPQGPSGPWPPAYPPPGAQPPEGQPSGGQPTGAPPGPAYGVPPAYPPHPGPLPGGHPPQRPVHRPGAVPLRPLGLGDLYDAAFRTIRHNPRATVGAALLVAVVAMALPVVVTSVLTWTVGTSIDLSDPDQAAGATTGDAISWAGGLGSLVVGALLQQLGLLLVSGMVAHVVAAAAIGRTLTLGEAWAATRGQRWRLVGLTALVALVTTLVLAAYALTVVAVVTATSSAAPVVVYLLVSLPVLVCLAVWTYVRLAYLAVAALMLERLGVLAALGRAWRLTGGRFWRTFGIAALTALLTGAAGYALALPVSVAGQVGMFLVGPEHVLLLLVLTQAVSTVLSSAFVAPFSTAVASLQYLDLRIRDEAYDVELMTQAGILSR